MFTSLSRLSDHKNRFILFTTALLFLPLFGGWFDPALRPRFSSFQVGLLQNPGGLAGSYNLLSFGVAGLILLVLFWRATVRDRRRSMILLSAALVFLALDLPLQVGLSRPAWLKMAIDGVQDFKNLMAFANSSAINTLFLSAPDSGIDGTLPTSLPGRLAITMDCLSYGWQAFVILSVVLLVSSIAGTITPEMPARPAAPFRGWVITAAVIVAVQIAGPLLAQWHLDRAESAVARHDVTAAERHYRAALADDAWYRFVPDVFDRLGRLQRSQGNTVSPEAEFSLGREEINRNAYDTGMDLLLRAEAATRDPVFREVLRDEIGSDSISQGQTYFSGGAQGQAEKEFQRAMVMRPDWIRINYMVGRCEDDLSNYYSARQWYEKTLALVHPLPVKALCLSSIGDTYYRTGQLAVARDYYTKSLGDEYSLNLRGMKSLLDDYYR